MGMLLLNVNRMEVFSWKMQKLGVLAVAVLHGETFSLVFGLKLLWLEFPP